MADFPPRDDELTDPAVRQLLWRLRARLVSPPDAERAEQDLARLLSSAQEHAHDAPDPAGSADRPLPLEPVAGPSSLDDRRTSSGMVLGRVAAAVVLLTVVGGGIATARDGQLSLQVLLGMTATQDEQPVDLAAPDARSPSETAQDAGSVEPLPELGDLDLDAPDPADGVPDLEVEADPEPAESAPEPDADEPDPAPAPAPADGSAQSSDDTASAPPTSDPEPDPEPVEPQEPPASEVIAAPPARDLDGFGGPQPCPEDQDLATCLEDRASAEEAEDDGSGTGEDPTGDETGDDGEDPTGDETGGDAGTGDDAAGDEVTGDDDAGTGDDAAGDEVTGDDAGTDDDAAGDDGPGSEQDELARRRGAG